MTQQTINIGATPNDGDGDNLRTAFDKVNENFTAIWDQGPVDSNVSIAGNTISTTTVNTDLALSPNGTGNIKLNNNTVPGANNTWYLGSTSNRWRGVYAGNVDVGNLTVSDGLVVPGDVTIGGNLTVEGDTIQIGNITTDTKTIQLSNAASTTSAANGSGVTVGINDNIATMLYNSTGNTWNFNIGLSAAGNITAPYFIGNGSQLTGITSYANANAVAYANSGWAGNIIPSADNTYSLGNSTRQWSDLYVSNATIYMNNIPISLTAGNVLTVNGEAILSNDSNTTINTTGNITADYFFGDGSQLTGIQTTGNIEFLGTTMYIDPDAPDTQIDISPDPEGWAFLQLPNNATANSANTRLHNDAGNVEIGTGDFSTGSNSYEWVFTNTGNLNLPTNGGINVNGGGIVQTVDEDFTILVQDGDDDGFSVYLNVDDGAGTVLSSYQQQRDQFELGFPSTSKYFQFNDDGLAVFPGNINGAYGESMSIQIPGASASSSVSLRTIDNTDTLRSNITVDVSNVTVSTSNAAHTWLFDNTGKLTAPGEVYGQFYTIRGGNGPGTDIGSLGYAGNIVDVYGVEGVRISTIDESGPFWQFDITGNLAIPGTIVSDSTVRIDNRESGITADIQLYAADDILLQAGDRTLGDDAEGGDINIYAGDGAPDDNGSGNTGGGDIQIIGGRGGAAGNAVIGDNGGTVRLDAGQGGDGSANAAGGSGATAYLSAGPGGVDNGGGGGSGGDVVITAGDTTDVAQDRGSVILNAGAGGNASTTGGYVQVNIPSVGANPGGQWTFTGSGTTLETPANAEIFGPNFGNLTVGSAGNTIITSADYGFTTYNWVFDNAGGIVFPTLTVTRGDRTGTLTGSTIRIGNSTQEAILTTPNGAEGSDSQRLVINPGAGDGFGEGGDIYLYSGRGGSSGGSGGDIKIRGGLGPADGDGGYLDIMGGEAAGNGAGGYIDILGGQSTGSTGGPVRIYGGQGTTGGDANITGGVSTAGPGGGVNITGGVSSNGLAEYGNVTVTAGASTWTFNNTGTLIVPGDGVVRSIDDTIQLQSYDTPNSIARGLRVGTNGGLFLEIGNNQPWLAFTNDSGDAEIGAAPGVAGTGNAGYSLTLFGGSADTSVYGTGAGGDINLQAGLGATNDGGGGGPGGSINITAGNSYDPAGVSGNVTINSGSSTWTFDNTGNLTLPDNTFTVNYANGTAVSLGGNYGNAEVADFLDSLGSNAIVTTGNISGGNIIATANVLANGYASLTGGFDESQASTAGLYLGYAGGTPRIMFGTGNTSQTLEIDNDGGTLRFYKPGTTLASLTNTGVFTATGNVSAANVLATTSHRWSTGNATISLASGSISLSPDTSLSGTAGIIIGGSGYLLAPNGSRNAVLNYGGGSGTMGIYTVNIYGNTATAITNGGANGVGNIGANSSNRFNTAFLTAVDASGNVTGANIITAGSVNVAGNVNLTGAEGSDTARIFADVAGSDTSLVLEVGDDNGDDIVLRHYSFSAGTALDMLTAQRVSNTAANVSVAGNFNASGNITGNTAGYAIGYRDIPQISFTGNATIATTDAGKHYYSTQSSNYILTIANNASQSFQVGSAITVVNQGTGNITVAQGSGVTLYMAGNATSGNRSVATFGMATLIKVATDTWFINGTGVS